MDSWNFFDKFIILTIKNPPELASIIDKFKNIGIQNLEIYKFEKTGKVNAKKNMSLIEILTIKGCNNVCEDISKHYYEILYDVQLHDRVVIFEDDVEFCEPFNFDKLKRTVKWLKNNYWEMFYFGSITYPSIL